MRNIERRLTALRVTAWALLAIALALFFTLPTPAHATEPEPQVAIYVYPLLDPSAPPSWENSGTQVLLGVKDGTDWYTALPALPSGLCDGHLYGVQQDRANVQPGYLWPSSVTYPTTIGIPLNGSLHQPLTALAEVPACVTETPTPTQEPSVTPEPTTSANPPVQAAPPTAPHVALASTGVDLGGIVVGAALLILGVGMWLISRPKRRPRHWVGDGMTD